MDNYVDWWLMQHNLRHQQSNHFVHSLFIVWEIKAKTACNPDRPLVSPLPVRLNTNLTRTQDCATNQQEMNRIQNLCPAKCKDLHLSIRKTCPREYNWISTNANIHITYINTITTDKIIIHNNLYLHHCSINTSRTKQPHSPLRIPHFIIIPAKSIH